MKRLLMLLTAVVLSGAAATIALAAARSDRPSAHYAAFTVVLKNRDYKVVDLAPAGPSHGDIRVGNAELYNAAETQRIGSFHIFCTLTDPADRPGEEAEVTECMFTYSLPGGDITTQGITRRASIGDVAEADVDGITGGTRRYQTARGEVQLLPSQGDRRRIVFRLIL